MKRRASWELTILAFAMSFTVFAGTIYSLGIGLGLHLPFLVAPIAALAVAIFVRLRPPGPAE